MASYSITPGGRREPQIIRGDQPNKYWNKTDGPNLQQVTDLGSTTTNPITVAGLDVGDTTGIPEDGNSYFVDTDIFVTGTGSITSPAFITTGGTSADYVKGDGSLGTVDLSAYVPYTGATADVNLGTKNISAKKATLTSTQTVTIGNVTSVTGTPVSGSWLTYQPGSGYTTYYGSYYYSYGNNRQWLSVVAYKTVEGVKVFSTSRYDFYVDIDSGVTPANISISITPVAGADGYWIFDGGLTTITTSSISWGGNSGAQYTTNTFTLSSAPNGVNMNEMLNFSGAVLPSEALEVNGIVKFTNALQWKRGNNSLLKVDATNFFFGEFSGQSRTIGVYNTFYGLGAGKTLTSANTNVLLGFEAGKLLDTSSNTIIGALSGDKLGSTGGGQNTILGGISMRNATSANRTIAIGADTLGQVTTGVGNLAIGVSAGSSITTASNHWNIGTQVTSYDWNSSTGLLNFGNMIYGRGIVIATGNSNSKPVPTLSLGFGVMPHAQTDNFFRGGAMFGSKTGLGAEKITNSTCGNTTGWTLGTGWNLSTGFQFSGSTAGTISQTSANMITPLVVGKMYYLQISGTNNPNVAQATKIGVGITIGGVNLGTLTSVGEYIFVATTTDPLVITPTANNSVGLLSVSLKEVTQGSLVAGGDIQALGNFKSRDGSTGFTGTGAYTNFTIKNGIITNAT